MFVPRLLRPQTGKGLNRQGVLGTTARKEDRARELEECRLGAVWGRTRDRTPLVERVPEKGISLVAETKGIMIARTRAATSTDHLLPLEVETTVKAMVAKGCQMMYSRRLGTLEGRWK